MKTAITAKGNELTSEFDERFGRAAYFCIYDEESGAIHFEKNENADAHGGAGTKSAEKMADLQVKRVISGDFGPKAKGLLDKLEIQMVIIQNQNNTVQDIIKKIK